MEEEYDMKLSLEAKDNKESNFRNQWYQFSKQGLNRAWEEHEPDISDVQVKEPLVGILRHY